MSLDDKIGKDSSIEEGVDRKVAVATVLKPLSKKWHRTEQTLGSVIILGGAALEVFATYSTLKQKIDYTNHLFGAVMIGLGIYYLKLAKKGYENRARIHQQLRED